MSITKLATKEEKDNAAVVQTLMKALEFATEHKSHTVVILLQDNNGADSLGTPIRDYFSFLGHFEQLKFKIQAGAEMGAEDKRPA